MKVVLFIFLLGSLMVNAIAKTSQPTVDINNETMVTDGEYYIIPANDGSGGVTLIASDDQCTTLQVIEDVSSSAHVTRLAARFHPRTNDTVVRESVDLSISSEEVPTCPGNSTIWKLGGYDSSTGKWYLTTGGTIGPTEEKTVSNWFKIKPFKGAYKLSFCPSVCNGCKVVNGDIGIVGGTMQKRALGLNKNSLPVVFKKK